MTFKVVHSYEVHDTHIVEAPNAEEAKRMVMEGETEAQKSNVHNDEITECEAV